MYEVPKLRKRTLEFMSDPYKRMITGRTHAQREASRMKLLEAIGEEYDICDSCSGFVEAEHIRQCTLCDEDGCTYCSRCCCVLCDRQVGACCVDNNGQEGQMCGCCGEKLFCDRCIGSRRLQCSVCDQVWCWECQDCLLYTSPSPRDS